MYFMCLLAGDLELGHVGVEGRDLLRLGWLKIPQIND